MTSRATHVRGARLLRCSRGSGPTVEREAAEAAAGRGASHADEAARLRRFALWLRDAPVLAEG